MMGTGTNYWQGVHSLSLTASCSSAYEVLWSY